MPFTRLGLHPTLVSNLERLEYAQPTPVQTEAIPPALAGRDVLACAMTGSGKTAAFLLPIVQQLMAKPKGGIRALVLAPTRELAGQVLDELRLFAAQTSITGGAVIGGVSMGPQEQLFRRGVDVLVATPGRLIDHLRSSYASLDKIEHLVLDEADRMLDMGFLPDIRRIIQKLPAKRQTLLFSATIPQPIVALTRDMLHNPVTIQLERTSAPATGVTQAVYPVSEDLKSALLADLLERNEIADALVFTRTKHRCNRLTEYLLSRKISAERLHGNRSQAQRTSALAGFKSGKIRVLVATDIAARGIDVEQLGHVVNFDVPLASEDYIHRVGRTARASATGHAWTLVSPREESEIKSIERAIGKRIERVTVPGFNYSARPAAPLEIPLADRIRDIRARKSVERARSAAKQQRRPGAPASPAAGHSFGHRHDSRRPPQGFARRSPSR